jgi:hypothetical protein
VWLHCSVKMFGTEIIISGVYIPGENSAFHDASIFLDIAEDIIQLRRKLLILVEWTMNCTVVERCSNKLV